MSHPNMVPLLTIGDLAATRRFYLDELGCTPVLDQDGYLQVRFGDDPDTRELAFMTSDSTGGAMVDGPTFAGGLIVSVAVGDADTPSGYDGGAARRPPGGLGAHGLPRHR